LIVRDKPWKRGGKIRQKGGVFLITFFGVNWEITGKEFKPEKNKAHFLKLRLVIVILYFA
jgi:hypothetical protein